MKKIVLFAFATVSVFNLIAKEQKKTLPAKYKAGLGLQYTHPHLSASLKIGLTKHSVLQLTAAPISIAKYNINYYGMRYQYLFTNNSSLKIWGKNADDFPYLFAGAGLLQWRNTNSQLSDSYNSFLGYNAGLGYEVIFSNVVGISIEAGYGVMSISGSTSAANFVGGGGLHIYMGTKATKQPSASNSMPRPTSSLLTAEDDDLPAVPVAQQASTSAVDFFGGVSETPRPSQKMSKSNAKTGTVISTNPHVFAAFDGGLCTNTNVYANSIYRSFGGSGAVQVGLLNDVKGNTPQHRVLISYGLEGRLFSAGRNVTSITNVDGRESFRYWHLGVPVGFNYITTDALSRERKKGGVYFTLGLTPSLLVSTSREYQSGVVGTTSTSDSGLNKVALSSVASFGFAIPASKVTILVGPYATYTLTNLVNGSGIDNRIFSYGLRLVLLPNVKFKK